MAITQPTYPIQTQALVTHVGAYADAQVAGKANATDPTFSGTVTVPAPAPADVSTKAASTAYVALTALLATKVASWTIGLDEVNALTPASSSGALVALFPSDTTRAIPVGATGEIRRDGTGTVTLTPEAGVTFKDAIQISGTASRMISARMSSVGWYKEAANTFYLTGSLS
jgi:hypothetical protein